MVKKIFISEHQASKALRSTLPVDQRYKTFENIVPVCCQWTLSTFLMGLFLKLQAIHLCFAAKKNLDFKKVFISEHQASKALCSTLPVDQPYKTFENIVPVTGY
jgi:hypothetical protein